MFGYYSCVTELIKIVAFKEDYKYALFYQCNKRSSSGRCDPSDTYVDIMSRDRAPLPQSVLDQFGEVLYRYLCHERSEFVMTSQKGL